MPIVIPPRGGKPSSTPAPAAQVGAPKIVIPPRGSKPAPPSEKRVPVLPGAMRRAAVDSAAFNKSVLPSARTTPVLPEKRIISGPYEPSRSGVEITFAQLLEKHPLPLRADGKVITPYQWQHEDVNTLIGYERVGIFEPVGAGKTMLITYTALGWNADHYVVVLPPILIRQWVRFLNAILGSGGAVAYKGAPKVREAIDLMAHRWWVMSYVIFKNDYNKLLKLLHNHRYGLIIDEAHSIKNSESQLHKLAARFSAGQFLVLATGTELNKPDDGYGYVKIKTPGVYRSFGQFKNIHVGKEDFFGTPLEWQNLDLLHDNLYLQSVHRTKEEVKALIRAERGDQGVAEEANYQPLEYDLDDAHMKLYRELGEQQVLELESGGKIDATTQQTLWNHMQQVVINPGAYGRTDLRPAAFDIIDMILDQLDFENMREKRKLIVWTWYQQSTELVQSYLNSKYPGRTAVAYGKSNSDKEFFRFQTDPECWFMVAQPLSAGAGVEPQYVCYNSLFLETPTRTIPFRQAAGRIDRDGQSERANIWIGIARGTIQETLYQNLLSNDELVQRVQKNPRDIRKMIYGGE